MSALASTALWGEAVADDVIGVQCPAPLGPDRDVDLGDCVALTERRRNGECLDGSAGVGAIDIRRGVIVRRVDGGLF